MNLSFPLKLGLVAPRRTGAGLEEALGKEGDQKLVQRCLKRDQHAFRELYKRHVSSVRSTLYRMGDRDQLDDLTQEVFLRLWNGLATLKELKYFSTWVYRVSVNVAIDSLRRLKTQQRLSGGVPSSSGGSSEDPSYLREGDTEAASFTRSLASDEQLALRELLEGALAQLEPQQLSIIVLCEMEELPQAEVARILQIPLGTVKSRLFSAKKELRAYLQKKGVNL